MKELNFSGNNSSNLNSNLIACIPVEKLESSLNNYIRNTFAEYLTKIFGKQTAMELLIKYFIGTPEDEYFSAIFWQIDLSGNIRTGKSIRYGIFNDEETFGGMNCKMIKDAFPYYEWMHTPYKQYGFSLKQCFFGEHLLHDTVKPIAIVEGEKTAVIASMYLPQYIWLATSGSDYLTVNKCKVLKGRNVVLYPHVCNFDTWKEKMMELSRVMPGTSFNISEILEKDSTYEMIENDWDIADYLIKFDWRSFKKK